eukprot:7860960-Pyramimonas_sp.AAC.1
MVRFPLARCSSAKFCSPGKVRVMPVSSVLRCTKTLVWSPVLEGRSRGGGEGPRPGAAPSFPVPSPL